MPKKKAKKASSKALRRDSKVAATKASATATSSDGLVDALASSARPGPQDGTIEVEDVRAIASARCYLLEMTPEIRQNIWKYAVKEDKAIKPKQLERGSNMFAPGLVECVHQPGETPNVLPEPLPTAVQLSLTCHQIYDEITGAALFYRLNDFEFDNNVHMLTYLVAITPIRINAIRSVTLHWGFCSWSHSRLVKHALTMLATCEGLRSLKVILRPYYSWDHFEWHLSHSSGFHHLKMLGGIERFKLEYIKTGSSVHPANYPSPQEVKATKMMVKKLAKEYGDIVSQPRKVVLLKSISAAQEASNLNIYGAGRLGPDKKPAIVASRTRGQLQKQKSLNDKGLFPEIKDNPKFSTLGELRWGIKDITEGRELSGEESDGKIELFVTWANNYFGPPSWEVFEDILNSDTAFTIAKYFIKNPDGHDLGYVIKTFKETVDWDKKAGEKKIILDSLETVMKREESAEAASKARRIAKFGRFR